MDPKPTLQNCLKACQDSAQKFRTLAQTESSQTAKEMLLDAAHHLDVAQAECTFAEQMI